MKKALAAALILALLAAVPAFADEAMYRQAGQHFEKGLYYTAREEFLQSQWGNWEEWAAACILPWPENGEIWQGDPGPEKDVRVVFDVEQEEKSAHFFRVFRDGLAVSEVFVGGPGKIELDLAAGTYEIWMGMGSQWFGRAEIFGSDGIYQTMAISDDGSSEVELKSNYAYDIYIGPRKPEPPPRWEEFK